MTHVNPGTDTTINPVVIDDSYREMRQPQPRKEVARFAEAMEAVLRKHDDKGGWENCGLAWLIDRAQEELNEAKEKWDAKNFKGDYDAVATELIDVANFCMMFYDNVQNDGYHHDHPYPNTSAPAHPPEAQQRNEYKFNSTELLLLAHDEWKRREERKHNHEEPAWVSGFLNGFCTDKKWAREYVDALLQAGRK